ncbi:MAG TPA: aspartate-semialdehyde dehydrogenase, partial [Gemmatimonadales bacterium]|nr:aspartate-semialdehyde dehydrogenase [Gemmatimonadales bacterium]
MSERIPVAVLGATGVVGQRIVRRLIHHPRFELVAIAASERSAGKRYGDALHWVEQEFPPEVLDLVVARCTPDDASAPIVLSALDAESARRVEPEFAKAGSLVVTNASTFRMEEDVPLIIPEINPDHLALLSLQQERRGWEGGVIANPNCATAVIALALAPLHRRVPIRRVAVTTLQAASGAGHPGVASLDLLGNVIPHIAGEEEKLRTEPRKLLGTLVGHRVVAARFGVSAQVTRVPVPHGHMASLAVEFDEALEAREARECFRGWEGIVDVLDGADRPQPRRDVDRGGGMTVAVGQIRDDGVFGLRLVALGHNLERGAAGAAVANAELVAERLSGAYAPTRRVGPFGPYNPDHSLQ